MCLARSTLVNPDKRVGLIIVLSVKEAHINDHGGRHTLKIMVAGVVRHIIVERRAQRALHDLAMPRFPGWMRAVATYPLSLSRVSRYMHDCGFEPTTLG